jgi:alpha-maltose-1-phosphate synthase
MISVDIKSAGEAIARLSLDANGRNKMGEAARLHAAANFDWHKILPSYDALFAELKRIRSKNQGVGMRDRGRETANAAVPDPFRIFSGFATQALSDTTVVSMSRNGGALRAHMAGLLEPQIAGIAGHAMLPPAELDHLLDRIETGPVSIASLCSGFADFHRDQILASCAWLLKYGLIETALRNSLD